VLLVFVSLAGIIVYRVIISVDYCTSMSAVSCLVTGSIISALLNAVSILILGKVKHDPLYLHFSMLCPSLFWER